MTSPSDWTALILAGGFGTRLQRVVQDRPKPMAPVAGRPFVEWLVIALKKQGVRSIVFCTGHLGDALEEHFGEGKRWDLRIAYSREETPLGTGGALRLASGLAGSALLLAANGDSYCPFDLSRLARAHSDRGARGVLWLVPAEDSSRYGSVELGNDGQVIAFSEKSRREGPGLISAGIYLFERAVIEEIPADRPVSLEQEVLPALAGRGELYGVVGEGPFLDIGTPEAYERAESFFAMVGVP
jgi:NDP-sugar pyrophosphorylase family protein